jgi:hypothetical protein
MARSKKRTPQTEAVRGYVEAVAKNLIDKLYGPEGPRWGTKLTEIEDLFLEIREVLSEKMLAHALARQAAGAAATPACCPGFQRAAASVATNERVVETRAGAAEWAEPERYCDRCRRDFFPSVAEPGHGSERSQPGGAADDRLRGDGRSFVRRGR